MSRVQLPTISRTDPKALDDQFATWDRERGVRETELSGWRLHCQLHADQYPSAEFERDLAPAFRYGLAARSDWRDLFWNSALEAELEQEWGQNRGPSRLPWLIASKVVRQGFEGFRGERPGALPKLPALTPVRLLRKTRLNRWWNRLIGIPA